MDASGRLLPYQIDFIEFLVRSGALKFGEFTLKSGRKAPYFINTGSFDSGESLGRLGSYYAAHIARLGLECDVLFGPAYKGIPLCVSTAIALAEQHNRSLAVAFDRKEAKDHGDRGVLIGRQLRDGDRVMIVDDVITAGTTFRQIVPLLTSAAKVRISGVVIAVDRGEKGAGEQSAVQELRAEMGLEVYPLLTIHQLVHYLSEGNQSGFTLSADQRQRIDAYLQEYGAHG